MQFEDVSVDHFPFQLQKYNYSVYSTVNYILEYDTL
jgi:hypothetical protein